MKTPLFEKIPFAETSLTISILRTIWTHFPLILFMDVALSLSTLPAIAMCVIGLPLLAPWVAILTFVPAWTATCAIANSLLYGEPVSWRAFLKAICHHWKPTVAASSILAGVVTIFWGTSYILGAYPHMTWLYLPLFVDGCVIVFFLLAGLSAFSLLTLHSLRGWALWKVSLAMTTLQPGKMLGTVALFVALGLLLALLNAGLLPLLLAPLALCLTALTRQRYESLEQHHGSYSL